MDRRIDKRKPEGATSGFPKVSANSRKQNQVVSSFLLHFPAVCKAGGKKIFELIQIRCRECGVYFCICRRCYRGQAYCCEACRVKGYRSRHREAQKRYRGEKKGKQKRCELEKNRRWRMYVENEKSIENKKPKDEKEDCDGNIQALYTQYTQPCSFASEYKVPAKRKRLGENGYCHLCGAEGIIVEKFPRRGYDNRNS